MAPLVVKGAVDHGPARNVGDAASIAFACLPGAAISQAVAAEVVWGQALRVCVEMSTIGSRAMGVLRISCWGVASRWSTARSAAARRVRAPAGNR
jgi:hypothetical protein